MPIFGQNETGQRLHTSGVGVIYVLKSDDKKVIKVLQPSPGIWSDDQLREEIDGFLLRAKTQRNIAKISQNWTHVHEASAIKEGAEGSSGGGEAMSLAHTSEHQPVGAYAVMDRYERSAASLIDGRVNLNNDDLRNLMAGTIRGLIDIRKIASRPHGNLKPSNILLTDAVDLAKAVVHLTDPAPDGALSPKAAEKDLIDLAKILYELVNLRPYQGGTIGKTKDWDELGPNGEDWRKLCNTLLDPSAPAEDRDLEKVLATIDTWRAKPKKSKLPMILAAVVVLLIGGGIAAWIFTRPPKIDFDEPRWEKLCFTYQSWMSDFLDHMDDSTKQKYSADPYPAEVVALLNKAGRDLDQYQPRKIAKRPTSYAELAVNPTDDAKTGYAPYYTKQGAELADNIADALTPAKWPVLQKLDQTATIYEKRGWLKPASGIRSLIEGAKPPVLPIEPVDVAERAKKIPTIDLAANIDNTIKASHIVATIDQRWNNIENEIKQLPDTNVPLLKSFPQFAEDVPRSALDPGKKGTLEDVQSLSTAFASIDKVAKDLLADLNSKDHVIVYDELAKDPAVQLPADGKLTMEMYTSLPTVAQGYFKMKSDPRTTVEWAKSLDDVQNGMINVIAEANKQDEHLPQLVAGHDAIQKEVADMGTISPIEKNRSQIESLVAKTKEELTLLQHNGDSWVNPYRTDPDKYVAEHEAAIATSPVAKTMPIVYAQWKKADNALLDKVRANKAQLKKDYHYKLAIDDKFNKLEADYLAFDSAIPAQLPGISQITGNDWRHNIANRIATTYRENAINDLMTTDQLKWADDLPQVDNPAYQSYAHQRLAAFAQNRVDAMVMIDDFTTMQEHFDRLELLPDEPTKGSPFWRNLYTKWKASRSPLLSDTQISTQIQPIADRANALSDLDAITAYQPLFDKTNSPAPEIILTAWRKMGAAPVTQESPVLADEDAAETRLAAHITTLSKSKLLDANQLAAFTQEMKTQRPLRWRRWADTLASANAIQTALDRRADFGVTLDTRTDASMIFNDAYYQLRKIIDKNPKDAEMKAAAQTFINAVSAMPANIKDNPDIQDLIARMSKSLTQSQDDSSSAGAGPQLAGWRIDTSKEGMRIFTFPASGAPRYTLKFLRLQVAQKSVYLCTTEMSVGLFADTVNASGKISELTNNGKPPAAAHWFNMPAKAGDDIWSDFGPRTWKLLDNKFDVNNVWLSEVAAQMVNAVPPVPYYPANTKPPAPTANAPMQLISPWSSMYVARLLGCRLPTSDEWKAAYDKYETTGPRDVWNLRGGAWQVEQDYAKQMNNRGMPYPDQGIFLTPELMFGGITASDATPWHNADLAKLAPNRITPGADIYRGNTIWFRNVNPAPDTMQDLVGNVAEYAFDGPTANAVIKDNHPTIDAVNATITAGNKNLFVIGGSSLSPPQIPFNEKEPLDPDFAQTATGFCDVGFRLAYTAPIDSIADVLNAKSAPYLHGSLATSH